MLRSFRLSNHRSFADEQELLLMPSQSAGGPVVPVAAIYGANASGKSNLIDALAFMQDAVLDSFARWDVDGGVPRKPFRLAPDAGAKPSFFVVELLIDDVRYDYGFAVDDEKVLEEWLYAYPKKRKNVVFERVGDSLKFGSNVDVGKARREVFDELLRAESLFISAAARVNWEPSVPVYEWFLRSLGIHQGSRPVVSHRLAARMRRFVGADSQSKARLLGLLRAADIGIHDFEVIEAEPKMSPKSPSGPTYELRFLHGESQESFSMDDESAGTRSWLDLLPTVLNVLDRGAAFVVDEIDTSLHPLLTAQLIGLFQNPETNRHGAQLVFTTHDTSLLGTMISREVLDRDQVWFVEKQADQRSKLFPLTDFKPRKDQNTERRYLGGSYGAVPVLDEQDFIDAVLGR